MSKNQQNAQSDQPLGSGNKTEDSGTNRILYAVLALLLFVFVWKTTQEQDQTLSIEKDRAIYPEVPSDKQPNVEIEINEADINPKASQTPAPITKITESGLPQTPTAGIVPKQQQPSKQHLTHSKHSQNSDKESIVEGSILSLLGENYSYIYASEVELPQGSFLGLNDEGFAMAKSRLNIDVEISRFDGKTGQLIVIPEVALYHQDDPNHPDMLPSFAPRTEMYTTATQGFMQGDDERWPTTGIPYGTEAYPLKDTLPWHPYESLAYIREEKEIFVAEKVRAMPKAKDLEPFIHPNTLGDWDTRMGYGVIIRPNRNK